MNVDVTTSASEVKIRESDSGERRSRGREAAGLVKHRSGSFSIFPCGAPRGPPRDVCSPGRHACIASGKPLGFRQAPGQRLLLLGAFCELAHVGASEKHSIRNTLQAVLFAKRRSETATTTAYTNECETNRELRLLGQHHTRTRQGRRSDRCIRPTTVPPFRCSINKRPAEISIHLATRRASSLLHLACCISRLPYMIQTSRAR